MKALAKSRSSASGPNNTKIINLIFDRTLPKAYGFYYIQSSPSPLNQEFWLSSTMCSLTRRISEVLLSECFKEHIEPLKGQSVSLGMPEHRKETRNRAKGHKNKIRRCQMRWHGGVVFDKGRYNGDWILTQTRCIGILRFYSCLVTPNTERALENIWALFSKQLVNH